jgi:hypothetical protein
MKPFNGCREALLKQIQNQMIQQQGGDHANNHTDPGLSRVRQDRDSWHGAARSMAMTEVVTSLLAFFSIGILAVHAFDAYRKRYAPAVRGSSSQPKANAGQWRFWKEKQDSEPVHTCSAPSLLIVAGSRINPQHGY